MNSLHHIFLIYEEGGLYAVFWELWPVWIAREAYADELTGAWCTMLTTKKQTAKIVELETLEMLAI